MSGNTDHKVLPDGFLDVDPFKYCTICGAPVKRGSGWSVVGMCDAHDRMYSEDIKSGFQRNRLMEVIASRIQRTLEVKQQHLF